MCNFENHLYIWLCICTLHPPTNITMEDWHTKLLIIFDTAVCFFPYELEVYNFLLWMFLMFGLKRQGVPKEKYDSQRGRIFFVFFPFLRRFTYENIKEKKIGDKIPHFWFFSPRWMLRMRIVYCWSKQLLLSAGNNYHARLATLSVSVFRVRMSLKFCKNPNRRKWLFVFSVSTICQFGVLTSVRS